MRLLLRTVLAGVAALAAADLCPAQAPGGDGAAPPAPAAVARGAVRLGAPRDVVELTPALAARPGDNPAPAREQSPADEVVLLRQQIQALRLEQQAAAGAQQDDVMKKRLELQQKQIAILEKMVRELAKQIGKQPAAGPAVEKLQGQVATLEARSKQAAQRDQELANAVDDLREERDSDRRYGPQLPATLQELFLGSGNNETPLSIYSTFAVGYVVPQGGNSGFFFGEFSPDFFIKLNDWIFFEGEFSAGSDGSVSLTFAQADFLVNDWLTVILGRFVAPIAWYNERLNNPWVNKLPIDAPDTPLLWRQVLPTLAMQGVQVRGAHYVCDSPIKLEYAAYVSNGLNLPAAPASINDLANLENMENTFTFADSNNKAVGGRVGFWWPEIGVAGGLSGMYNGSYLAGSDDAIRIWALDLNYHKGNWDVRAEYGMNDQDTAPFTRHNIRRQGVSAQVAYRQRDACNEYLRNVELVFRYGYVDFNGINPRFLDPTTFSSPIDVPIRRQQFDFGIDYWFSPRLVAQLAYEINDEFNHPLHDNQFIFELAWGW
jgi:hypothetical protein